MRISLASREVIALGLNCLLAALVAGCALNPLSLGEATPEVRSSTSTPEAANAVSAFTPSTVVSDLSPAPSAIGTSSPARAGSTMPDRETGTPVTTTPAYAETPDVTSTPAATDTPSATSTPAPNASLVPDVETLLSRLDSFEAAVRNGDTQAMLAKQQDLLAAADQTDRDLADDHSSTADHVRSALTTVRDGARGDLGRLGEARRALQEIPGVAASAVASPSASVTPVASIAEASASLRWSLDAFRAAVGEGRTDQLLSAQQQLLTDLEAADEAAQAAPSGQADQLRSAIADIRNALGGNYALLDTAAAKLGGDMSTPAASDSASTDQQLEQAARDLAQKVDAFAEAVQAGDTQKALNEQQEAMHSLAGLQQSLQGSDTGLAHDLRDAADTLRQGLNGDSGKLAEGKRKLANALGQQASGSTPSAGVPHDITTSSRQLDDKASAFQQAFASGDSNRLLQTQRDLLDQIARTESALQGDNSVSATQLRNAIDDLKGGLAGDEAKLQSARTKLQDLSGH